MTNFTLKRASFLPDKLSKSYFLCLELFKFKRRLFKKEAVESVFFFKIDLFMWKNRFPSHTAEKTNNSLFIIETLIKLC